MIKKICKIIWMPPARYLHFEKIPLTWGTLWPVQPASASCRGATAGTWRAPTPPCTPAACSPGRDITYYSQSRAIKPYKTGNPIWKLWQNKMMVWFKKCFFLARMFPADPGPYPDANYVYIKFSTLWQILFIKYCKWKNNWLYLGRINIYFGLGSESDFY